MGMSTGGNKGVKSEINVTPLVDVVLVLLIIFMVVTPELQRGKDVKLPMAKAAQQKKDGVDPIIISIKSDKTVYIEQEETNLTALPDLIRRDMMAIPGGRPVMIKGDASLQYGDVKQLVDVIRKSTVAGIKIDGVSLAAATEEKK